MSHPVNNKANHTVLIIADDLTGAADSTSAFARLGFSVKVIVDAGKWSMDDIDGYDVVAFNTETRNKPAEECISVVLALGRRLASLNPRLFLKIVDSTFRGQILPETAALMTELGMHRTVITSAHPLQKRFIRRGDIFVDGIPLRETSYARHQAPPPKDIPAAVRQTFSDFMVFNGLSTLHLPETPPPGIYLPDISEVDDLTRTARWVVAQGKSILPVGSSGLAHAFARFLVSPRRSSELPQPAPRSSKGILLIAVGSTLPEISNQIQVLESTRPDVLVVNAANGERLDHDLSTIDQKIVVLRMVRGTTIVPRDTATDNFAKATQKAMESLDVAQLITVGGSTASTILAKLGINGFYILPQDVVGMPHGEAMYKGALITYIAKSDGFGNLEVFADMAEQLQPRTMDNPT